MESELRIPADRAQREVESGRGYLVCAYDDEAKCRKYMLEGALTLKQLEERRGSIPEGSEILFYCA